MLESKCIGNPRISAAGKKSEPYTQILYKKVCGLRFPILTQQNKELQQQSQSIALQQICLNTRDMLIKVRWE